MCAFYEMLFSVSRHECR